MKEAIVGRDTEAIQRLAKAQVDHGAQILDLNIGPQKKEGVEVMRWLVPAVQEVVDVPLSLDTTNLEAIKAGLSLVKHKGMVNSTSGEPERLEKVPPVAAEYGARLIALLMGKSGIPMTAEERVSIAIEQLVPRAMEVGIPMERPLSRPAAAHRVGVPGVLPSRRRDRPLHQAGDGSGAHDHMRPQQRVQPGAR